MKKRSYSFTFNSVSVIYLLLTVLISSVSAEKVDDYDGDGKTDFTVVRINQQEGNKYYWYILKSGGGYSSTQWGFAPGSTTESGSDSPLMGDFDGDGKSDVAVMRIRAGDFPIFYYILRSGDQTMQVAQWGRTGDGAFPQDYDGDGKTDITIVRSTFGRLVWHIQQSRDGYRTIELPVPGAPITGDFDGDGKADCALIQSSEFAPKYFWVRKSSTGQIEATQFGNNFIDYAVPADYDGDGKTDLAVWRGANDTASGLWIWRRSSDGSWVSVKFGSGTINGDYPVPGDYDGDGKTDPAFFRRDLNNGQGYFYVLGSQQQGYYVVPWGRFNDAVPLNGLRAR